MPVDAEQTETTESTKADEVEGATPEAKPAEPAKSDSDGLAEAGKKALTAERAARKAAEKTAAEALARVKEFEDRDKSEAEKQAEKVAQMEAEIAKYRDAEQRREWARDVSKETGVPADVVESLRGDSLEDLQANAARIAPAYAKPEPVKEEKPAPEPVKSIGHQPSTENVPLKDQIAAAQTAGDKQLVAALKAMQLGN